MKGKFSNKIVLVTGGSSGIGREIALLFNENGAHVIIVGRKTENLHQTKSLSAEPSKITPIVCNLSNRSDLMKFCSHLKNEMNSLDIIVNNAGIFRPASIEKVMIDDIDETIEINFTAPLLIIRELLPLLKSAKGASIINISSTLATIPATRCCIYSASKAALLMLTKTAALEFAEFGIRCNAISPGVVKTKIFESVMPSEQVPTYLQKMAEKHPLKRIGFPKDIAHAALFLASDEASWITGVNMPVDGGISLT